MIIPLMGLLESIAIAKAYGKIDEQMCYIFKLLSACTAHLFLVHNLNITNSSIFLPASQNDYKIDTNQEIFSIGE